MKDDTIKELQKQTNLQQRIYNNAFLKPLLARNYS